MLGLFFVSVAATAVTVIGTTITGLLLAYYFCCCRYFDDSHRTGVRASSRFRSWEGWRALHRAFDAQIVRAEDLQGDDYDDDNDSSSLSPSPRRAESASRLIAVGPHGVSIFSSVLLSAHGVRPGEDRDRSISVDCRVAAADVLFWVPGMRELVLSIGAVSANRETMLRHLTGAPGFPRGGDLVVIPGGVAEMAATRRCCDDLYEGHRGFLAVAREAGADVVPVFAHGETDLFHVWSPRAFRPLQRLCVRWLSYPFPFFFWPTFLPEWLPGRSARRSLRLIVGRSLRPSDYETIDEMHAEFYVRMHELKRIGDETASGAD